MMGSLVALTFLAFANPAVLLTMEGQARGGEITLVNEVGYVRFKCFSMSTAPGETGPVLAHRLAEVLKEEKREVYEVPAGLLLGFQCYYMCGSEVGLKAPPTPKYVTIRYDPSTKKAAAKWLDYEGRGEVRVTCPFCPSDDKWGKNEGISLLKPQAPLEMNGKIETSDDETHLLPGFYFRVCVCARQAHPYRQVEPRELHIHVLGTREEDLDNLPFWGGVAPNFTAWNADTTSPDHVFLSQGEKPIPEAQRIEVYASSPETKCPYQLIETSEKGGAGGIYRRYLGLTPGKKYRVLARMNTFDADVNKGHWWFSLHACADGSNDGDLSGAQLKGDAPLPDGTRGSDAGQIARFGTATEVTKGQWREVSSGADNPGKNAGDIALPSGCSSISAWFKVDADCKTRVGTDWIAFEEVD